MDVNDDADQEPSVGERAVQIIARLELARRNIEEARAIISVKQVYLNGWLREEERLQDELNAPAGAPETTSPPD